MPIEAQALAHSAPRVWEQHKEQISSILLQADEYFFQPLSPATAVLVQNTCSGSVEHRDSLIREFPAVDDLRKALVPVSMSEEDFWRRFFYFFNALSQQRQQQQQQQQHHQQQLQQLHPQFQQHAYVPHYPVDLPVQIEVVPTRGDLVKGIIFSIVGLACMIVGIVLALVFIFVINGIGLPFLAVIIAGVIFFTQGLRLIGRNRSRARVVRPQSEFELDTIHEANENVYEFDNDYNNVVHFDGEEEEQRI